MKKLIVSKTIIFIAVVAFVGLFTTIFQPVNAMVGVATVILSLSLLDRNLAKHPIKNLFILLGGNLFLGIAAYLTAVNPWLGLIINFSVIFILTYLFSYKIRRSLSTLVALHYFFMIMAPISSADLPIRLVGLTAMAILILLINIVVNKNKLQKTTPKLMQIIEENLLEKINQKLENQNTATVDEVINANLSNFKMMNFNAISKNSKMSEYSQVVTGIVSCYEKLDYLIANSEDKKTLQKVALLLTNSHELNEAELKQRDCLTTHEYIKTFNLLNLQKQLLLTTHHEVVQGNLLIKLKDFKIDVHSVRFGYAFRLGSLMAIMMFVADYFNLEFGYWMACSALSITQIHTDYAPIKAKKRIYGTIIGSILVLILFNLIQDSSARTLVLLVSGYLMSFMVDYKNSAIFITLASVCSAAMLSVSPNTFVVERLIYTLIGIAVTLVVNKYVFVKGNKDEELEILNLKAQIKQFMLQETLGNEDVISQKLHDLYLLSPLIEERINKANLQRCKDELFEYKFVINQIHQLYLYAQFNEAAKQAIQKIKNVLSMDSTENMVDQVENQIEQTDCVVERSVYSQVSSLIQAMN